MATLYLIEQNTVLRKSSERLILCRRPTRALKSPGLRIRDVLLELPCEDIDQVMLFGNIQVTTQALRQLLAHGIELALFTFSGRLLGQLTPPKTKNINLRIAQFERYRDAEFALGLSQLIVAAKLGNALTVLRRHRWNHPDAFSDADFKDLAAYIEKLQYASDPAELRGLEGAGTAAYFRLFARMLKPPWTFHKRSRRPPGDPVNAVLSFGYVIVGAELQALLDGIGFDPYLGFYHTVHYGRPGLALDMLEEFRHCLVDRLAINLFNKHVLNDEDFYTASKGGVFLNSAGKRKFFEHYAHTLGDFEGASQPAGKARSYRSIFQRQIQALAKSVQENTPYQAFKMT